LEEVAVRHYYWQKIITEQLLIKPQRAHDPQAGIMPKA
jgi:hypothetical protein